MLISGKRRPLLQNDDGNEKRENQQLCCEEPKDDGGGPLEDFTVMKRIKMDLMGVLEELGFQEGNVKDKDEIDFDGVVKRKTELRRRELELAPSSRKRGQLRRALATYLKSKL